MAKIRQLSEAMIGKIAAGEVVERPAAAIKELVENSLDAGATAVTVEIREGGLSYIRVTDNGSGIDESDIRMAFERHATSKVSREQDLFSIRTLGFRGEALASIAAVSRVTMTTRTADRDSGLKVRNEGGKITDISEAACPVGTTITVSDLFYNVPVRRGFMKKAGQEASFISELIIQLILSRPEVSFRYLSNGKTELHSPGDGQLLSALHSVYGSRTVQTFRHVEGQSGGVLIHGFVGIGDNARGNRSQEIFFINGRVMHSRILNEAVERACRERVMIGKFPVCVLHLTLAYESVDVNIHPNKLEVRFRDEGAVSEAVFLAVFDALREKDAFEKPVEMTLSHEKEIIPRTPSAPAEILVSKTLPAEAVSVPKTEITAPQYRPVIRETANRPQDGNADLHPAGKAPASSVLPSVLMETADTSAKQPSHAEQVNTILPSIPKPIKVFGALFNTYILIEYEDQLMMVDQHALHERLLFDRLMREHNDGKQHGQELLVPMICGVTRHELRLLEDNREELNSIGLTVEAFGENDIAVRSIPMILGEAQTQAFLRDILKALEEGGSPTFEKKRTALLQTACKHAVKGGEALTEDQIRDLLDKMIQQKVTPTCPHGRPLVVSITHRELDKKFKRIQS